MQILYIDKNRFYKIKLTFSLSLSLSLKILLSHRGYAPLILPTSRYTVAWRNYGYKAELHPVQSGRQACWNENSPIQGEKNRCRKNGSEGCGASCKTQEEWWLLVSHCSGICHLRVALFEGYFLSFLSIFSICANISSSHSLASMW